jgi:hypothetical protein
MKASLTPADRLAAFGGHDQRVRARDMLRGVRRELHNMATIHKKRGNGDYE